MADTAARIRRATRRALLARARDVAAGAGTRSALVVAPHPDDETLGCGARLHLAARSGASTTVVVLTDGSKGGLTPGDDGPGEGGSCDGTPVSPDAPHLSERRSAELATAMTELGVSQKDTVELGYPDGDLGAHVTTAAAQLRQLIIERRPDDVYVTCRREGHPDHAAAAAATRLAVQGLRPRPRLWEYPIWLWADWPVSRRTGPVRGLLEALVWLVTGAMERVSTAEVRAVKQAALDSYVSQLGDEDGDASQPTTDGGGLPQDVLDRALDGPELFFRVGRPARLLSATALVVAAIVVGGWSIGQVAQPDTGKPTASRSTSPLAAFPDAASTGVPTGTALKRVPEDLQSGSGWHTTPTGTVIIDRADVVLSGLDIRANVQNDGLSGLQVQNTRIRCVDENDWCLVLGPGAVVRDTEVGGLADGQTFSTAVGIYSGAPGAPSLIQRVNLHHLMNPLRTDGNTVVSDSWIHDVPMGDAVYDARLGRTRTDMHTDGLMTTRGGGIVVRHNRFSGGNTACLFVQWDVTDSTAPRVGSVTVEDNLFMSDERHDQDSSWAVAIETPGVDGPVTVRRNTFEQGWGVGPIKVPPGAVVSENRYTDGSPVS